VVYKKYIKRGGKLCGPYYYESIRLKDGSVKNVYLGNTLSKIKQQKIMSPIRNKLLIFILIFLILTSLTFLNLYYSYPTNNLEKITTKAISVESNEQNIIEKAIKNEKSFGLFQMPPSPTNFYLDASGEGFIDSMDTGVIIMGLLSSGYCEWGLFPRCKNLDADGNGQIEVPDLSKLRTLIGCGTTSIIQPKNITVVSNTSDSITLHVNPDTFMGSEFLAGVAIIPEIGEKNNVTFNTAYNITNDSGEATFNFVINEYNQQQILNFTILNTSLWCHTDAETKVIAQINPINTTFNFNKDAPVNLTIFNITLEPNITTQYLWENNTFNCSMSFMDTQTKHNNISWFWFEEDTILISNLTNGMNMSNHTNVINSTYWAPYNLTNGSETINYKYGYNYSCGACIWNGSKIENHDMRCVNSSKFQIIDNLKITKLEYLGNKRGYSIGVDFFGYLTSQGATMNYNQYYHGLKDIMKLYLKTNQTKISIATIPNPNTNNNYSNMSTSENNFRWMIADLEYDKYVYTYPTGYLFNFTEGVEYLGGFTIPNNLSNSMNMTENSYKLYKEVIGRNATSFKFPQYIMGPESVKTIYSKDIFPYKTHLVKEREVFTLNEKTNNTIELSTNADPLCDVDSSFINNYFVEAYTCEADLLGLCACLNDSSYFDSLLTNVNYAEVQSDISYLDFGELGEIYSMYAFTDITLMNDTRFSLVTTSNWTYKKRLAINITGIFTTSNQYLNLTTPSGLRIAQNMTTYTGSGTNRGALIIIPVENGNYDLIPVDVQSPDPSFIIENLTIFANNTKWSFNGTDDSNSSAYAIFKITWTGNANVWGDYNNTNTDFNMTHGFKFNHSKKDDWWVEHDMKSGKLHILGNSSTGTETIHAEMPFTFTQSVETSWYDTYILNMTNVFTNISQVNVSIPETYDGSRNLTVKLPNGTNINTNFYPGGSIIFSVPIIQEDSSIVIDYTGAAPGSPSGGGDSPSNKPPIEPPKCITNCGGGPTTVTVPTSITYNKGNTILKLSLEDVGLKRLKPKLDISLVIDKIEGIPSLFKMFNWKLVILIIGILNLIMISREGYRYYKIRI